MKTKKPQRGFSLVELLIVIVILAVIGSAIVGGGACMVGCEPGVDETRQNAEGYARSFARTIYGFQDPRVMCAGRDTDHNRYVTCTVSQVRDGGRAETHQIECPANWLRTADYTCREFRRVYGVDNQGNGVGQ